MRLNPVRKCDPPAYPALDEVTSNRRGFLQKLGLVAGAIVAGAVVAGCQKTSGEPPAPEHVGGTPQPPTQNPPVQQVAPPDEHAAGGLRAPEVPEEPAPEVHLEPPMERIKGDYAEPEQMKPVPEASPDRKPIENPPAPK